MSYPPLGRLKHGLPHRNGPWPLAASFPSVRKIPRKFLSPGIPLVCRPSPPRPTGTPLVLVVNSPSMLRLAVLGSVSPLVVCGLRRPLVSSGFASVGAGCVGRSVWLFGSGLVPGWLRPFDIYVGYPPIGT